jgi:hypothetical protein
MQLQQMILALLDLFRSHVPDPRNNSRVAALIADTAKWSEAHDLFHEVRGKTLRRRGQEMA